MGLNGLQLSPLNFCNRLSVVLASSHLIQINGNADITFAAHCHNVNVLLSNISLFDFCCFSSAS